MTDDRIAEYRRSMTEANRAFDLLISVDPENQAYWDAHRRLVLEDLKSAMRDDLKRRLKSADQRVACPVCAIREQAQKVNAPYINPIPLGGFQYGDTHDTLWRGNQIICESPMVDAQATVVNTTASRQV